MAIDQDDFRETLGSFATGVTVVATAHEGVLHGMTVNAFASVSLDPPLVLVCVDRMAGMQELLPRARTFAVTVLAHDQRALSEWFASSRRPSGQDQFDDVAWRPAPVTGSPVLTGGIAAVDCEVTEVFDGGDHAIYLARVVALERLRDADPLLFHRGDYWTLRRQ